MPTPKILFVTRSTTVIYNLKNLIKGLSQKGCEIHAIFGRPVEKWTQGSYLAPLEEFAKSLPGKFSYEIILPDDSVGWGRSDGKTPFLSKLRSTQTYRRYLKIKGQSAYYRDRYLKTYVPKWMKFLFYVPVAGIAAKYILKRGYAGKLLKSLEDGIPPDPQIVKKIAGYGPDAVITSLGDLPMGSIDLEYLKAANALGIPTAAPTVSWDFLTTKGLITLPPKLLLVWNQIHAKEAEEHHGIGAGSVKVTGASLFDDWFSAKPSLSRREFCGRYGLKETEPIVTYLGSSANMVKDETWLARKFREALDEAGLKNVQIIVRPHPLNVKHFRKFELANSIVLPREGAMPDTKVSLQFFYDCLFHSVAAIGVNTSAMIETFIAGRPVVALLEEKYKNTQTATMHFSQVMETGALETAKSLSESAEIIKRLIAGDDRTRENRKACLEKYIRPLGLGKSAGEAAADEVARLINLNSEAI